MVRSVKPKCIPKPENKAVIKGKSSFFIKSASTSDAEIKKENGGTSKEETKDNNKGKCALFPKTVSSGSADSKKGKETSKNPAKQEAKVYFGYILHIVYNNRVDISEFYSAM